MRENRWLMVVTTLVVLLTSIFAMAAPVQAAAGLSITPITWNVVGLDSNNVNSGPNIFPVGVRVCNTGDSAVTNVTSAFTWDSNDPYIQLRSGSNASYTLPSLAAGACADFY